MRFSPLSPRATGAIGQLEIVGESNTLFAAGFDTSAHTLTLTSFLLAQHPDALDRVVDELHGVLQGTIRRLVDLA